MFFDTSVFDFVADLEANWLSIREELDRLHRSSFQPWPERFLYEGSWNVFGLFAMEHRLTRNCDLCPKTTRIVERIPGLTTAGFSWLEPKTRIAPHTGYTNSVLRCHLGLYVPEFCGIRVGNVTRTWVPGRCMIFDDTLEHEAWNESDQVRVVLLLDFRKSAIPELERKLVQAQT
jgi:ornithine lipid ester-linked acyl 2-hydroxylase